MVLKTGEPSRPAKLQNVASDFLAKIQIQDFSQLFQFWIFFGEVFVLIQVCIRVKTFLLGVVKPCDVEIRAFAEILMEKALDENQFL